MHFGADEIDQAYYQKIDREFVCSTTRQPKDIVVVRASGCKLWTADGREFLDLMAGVAVNNVGHANREVVAAVKNQAERYLHATVFGRYVIPPQAELARRLAEVMPGGISQTFFTNSGTEAVEGALKLARKFTGRQRFISFERGFHGRTMGALSVTWKEMYRKPFEPLIPGVTFVPFDDLAAVEAAMDESVAAVIVEPIQGEGGVRVPSEGFLPGLRRLCDQFGALLIFDEIQTGFGRTGRLFACEHWNTVPDVLVMAKALGGGMPLGGFAARPEVMATLSDPPLSHLTTFGGHPVSCAAGLASLEFILANDLSRCAQERGRQLMEGLLDIGKRIPAITDVRGKGLLIGLELANESLTQAFVGEAHKRGVILGWTIHASTTVRIAPPLVISSEEVQRALEVIEAALLEVVRRA